MSERLPIEEKILADWSMANIKNLLFYSKDYREFSLPVLKEYQAKVHEFYLFTEQVQQHLMLWGHVQGNDLPKIWPENWHLYDDLGRNIKALKRLEKKNNNILKKLQEGLEK